MRIQNKWLEKKLLHILVDLIMENFLSAMSATRLSQQYSSVVFVQECIFYCKVLCNKAYSESKCSSIGCYTQITKNDCNILLLNMPLCSLLPPHLPSFTSSSSPPTLCNLSQSGLYTTITVG